MLLIIVNIHGAGMFNEGNSNLVQIAISLQKNYPPHKKKSNLQPFEIPLQ